MIEEISKEDFLEIAGSDGMFDPSYRAKEEPLTKTTARDPRQPGVPMSHDSSSTPTIIDTDKIDKKLLSPQVEWAQAPEPTNLAPQAVSVQDLHRGGVTGRPDNLASPDEVADEENLESVAPKKRAAPRKRTTPARKSVKK